MYICTYVRLIITREFFTASEENCNYTSCSLQQARANQNSIYTRMHMYCMYTCIRNYQTLGQCLKSQLFSKLYNFLKIYISYCMCTADRYGEQLVNSISPQSKIPLVLKINQTKLSVRSYLLHLYK